MWLYEIIEIVYFAVAYFVKFENSNYESNHFSSCKVPKSNHTNIQVYVYEIWQTKYENEYNHTYTKLEENMFSAITY